MKNSSYDDRQKNQDIIDAVSRRMTTKSDIDASVLPRVVSCDQKYQCAIFTILDEGFSKKIIELVEELKGAIK